MKIFEYHHRVISFVFALICTCLLSFSIKLVTKPVDANFPSIVPNTLKVNNNSIVQLTSIDGMLSRQQKNNQYYLISNITNNNFFATSINTNQIEQLIGLDPSETRPKSPSTYCWVPDFIGPIQQSPLSAPTPFLYQPFDMRWDGSGRIWSSTMDHVNPNYQSSGGVASLGENLSGENIRDRYTINGRNLDYYFSTALEVTFGYDGHDGHDFRTFGAVGVSALAAASGEVVYTRKDCHSTYNALGCYVEIYHPQGYLTRYAHLDSVLVNKDDWVEAGDPIGVIGTTGASTGIHLHFSVFHWNPDRINGSQQGEWEVTDPFGWDPWLPPEDQDSDPLYYCNGEVSYNLWVNGWPQKVGEGASPGSSGPQAFAVGGWLEDDLPYFCPSPSTGTPRDNLIISNSNGQVTFTWTPPSCAGLDYYTFRISNHADIDNPPWIIDHGVASNAASLTETISSNYNGQTLYWAIWPHNNAGYGSKGGPWSFKIDTSTPPPPPPLPTGNWSVQYFRNKELTDQCSTTSFDRTFIFQDWGEGAPATGCNNDNWSARYTRRVNFQGGNYDFAVEADDWGRIYVDNNLFVDKWNGATQHYEGHYVSPGEHDVRIEFADTLGGAKISAWWWGPGFSVPHDTQDPNQWYANYWLNQTQWWDTYANVNEGTGILNHDWGYDSPGWEMPTDNFSAKFRRTAYFECGNYLFTLNHDDGAKFWLDNVLKVDRWSGPIGYHQFTLPMTRGIHNLQVDMYENGGSANIFFDWQQVSNCSPTMPILQYPYNTSSLAWDTDLSLQWSPSSEATHYYVQLQGGPGVDINSGWISNTQWYIGGLWSGIYTWTVTSRNEYGSSSQSLTWSFTIQDQPVEPPADHQVFLPAIMRLNNTPGQWTNVLFEDFEGIFPGNWTIYDFGGTDGAGIGYQWKDRNCLRSVGNWAGWAVGGGNYGTSLSCDSQYPNNAATWMIYGPINLSDVTNAELQFDLWLNTEIGYDFVYWGASENNQDFTMKFESGNTNGWTPRSVSLANINGSSFIGKPEVWIAFIFTSDSSISYPTGAIIDEILFRKCIGGICQ